MTIPRLKYNPSHMPEDVLIRSFVVRQRDLAAILETVRENTGSSNQHLLILGPRGMGKTTLVNRAVAEIRRDPELSALWYPIAFDEESYTVTSAGELWLQALSHLADQTQSRELDQARRALQTVSDRNRLRDASLARLLEFADAQGKRLLVVFENIDMIFDEQLSEDDSWDVRHTLQNEPRIMALATSPTRLESFHNSEKPLYELFREHTLERLDLEECRVVWRLVTGADLPLNRARPIQIFTGGNTRLLTILATFAKDRSFRELMDDLVGLIDENTPYFKHNIEALPKDSRKIFVTLADLWSPATSRQVADQIRGDIRAVSAQLGRLERQGIVDVVRRVDKTQMFQVSERMYNLYYLLRRRGSARVRAVVEFIIRYYDDHDGIQVFLESLAKEACDLEKGDREDHVRAYVELMRRIPDQQQRNETLQRAPLQFLELPDIASLLRGPSPEEEKPYLAEEELRQLLAKTPDDLPLLLQMGSILLNRGQVGQAYETFDQALALAPSSPLAFVGWLSALRGDRSITAAVRTERLHKIGPHLGGEAGAMAYNLLILDLLAAGAHDDARNIANEALERWPDNHDIANTSAAAFVTIGDLQAARDCLNHSLDIEPGNSCAAEFLSQVMLTEGAVDEAEAHLRMQISRSPGNANLWTLLADLISDRRQDREAASRELRTAIEFNPTNAQLMIQLGDYLAAEGNWPQAEEKYRHAFRPLQSIAGLPRLVVALIAQQKADEARSLVTAEKVKGIESADLHFAEALLYIAEGKPDLHLFHLGRAADIAPRDAQHFIERHPSRSLVLQFICAFIVEGALLLLAEDAIRWSQELVELSPENARNHLLLAQTLALINRYESAWEPVRMVLGDERLVQRHLREVVAFLSLAAARGHAARGASVLVASSSATLLEPLAVALRMIAGEEVSTPQEVREVANDIVRDIERLRQHLEATQPAARPSHSSTTEHQRHRRSKKRSRNQSQAH